MEKIYKCPKCGFKYKDKEWAQKCKDWCSEHHTCNLEIISHAESEEKDYQPKSLS